MMHGNLVDYGSGMQWTCRSPSGSMELKNVLLQTEALQLFYKEHFSEDRSIIGYINMKYLT